MEQKKATRAQLESKIKNATLIVGKAKKSITLDGITIYLCKDEVVCSTVTHSHVYQRILANGNNYITGTITMHRVTPNTTVTE